MTSIEWLRKELWEQFNFSFSDNIFEKAKEMHKQEIEISDENIKKQSWIYEPRDKFDTGFLRKAFIRGAEWYREQLKQL